MGAADLGGGPWAIQDVRLVTSTLDVIKMYRTEAPPKLGITGCIRSPYVAELAAEDISIGGVPEVVTDRTPTVVHEYLGTPLEGGITAY